MQNFWVLNLAVRKEIASLWKIEQRPALASEVKGVPHHLALYTSSPLTAEVEAQFLTRSFGMLLGEVGMEEVFLKVL